MTDYAIRIEGLCKSFRRQPVLQNATLLVPRGKTFAFLGRNGAGKTTAIRILMGLLPRDAGTVSVLGCDPATDALEIRRRVGYLAEDQTMYGWMRVEQLLSFVAPFYPTWDHALAYKYLQQFELPPKGRIKHLSKGQNVRLGLALALAHRPECVILDDPALGLDPVMRKQFNRDLVAHLQGEGRTVFYSSHLLHEVEPLADEVAILHEGRVLRQADPEVLRRDVRQFVLAADALPAVRDDLSLLDLQSSEGEVAVVVENASAVRALLDSLQIDYREFALNLDDIFTAYVAGTQTDLAEGAADPVLEESTR